VNIQKLSLTCLNTAGGFNNIKNITAKITKTEHVENGGFDALGRFAFSRLCVE